MTKINNHLSKECVIGLKEVEGESYLKMIPAVPPLYPVNPCHFCSGCGSLFQSTELLVDHWEHSSKCQANMNDKLICENCKSAGIIDPKMCKHFDETELQGVMVLDASHVITYDQSLQTGSNQNDFNCMNTGNYKPASASKRRYTQEVDSEKDICHLPPPPQNDPQKPLPYRIDFLLNSGVIKHAKMNMNGKSTESLYFEKKRPRKPRTHFSNNQIEDLEKVFQDKKYLSANERQIIATDLLLHEEQVKNWFQNRRSRWRKDWKDRPPEHVPPQEELNHLVHQEEVKKMNNEHDEPPKAEVTAKSETYHAESVGVKMEIPLSS